eukprot:COSAG01_NODE_19287_length_1019_cov_1.240217_2_plen_132_part_01
MPTLINGSSVPEDCGGFYLAGWPNRNATRTAADFDRMDRCLPNTGWNNSNMVFMGLSMRTKDWRFTECALALLSLPCTRVYQTLTGIGVRVPSMVTGHKWLGDELRPAWDDGSQMIELYDHRDDPPESTKVS